MEVLHPAPLDFWQAVADACPWATYFHTPSWASVITKTFPEYSLASFGFMFKDGAQAVIPFVVEEKKRLFRIEKKYKSMEPGVYGGIIADRELAQAEVDEIIQSVITMKHAGGRIVGNPFKTFSFPARLKKKEMVTQVVDLTSGFDMLWETFSRGQKSNIKQAQKKNVSVRLAATEKDIEHYVAIYSQTLKRWGKKAVSSYPGEFFTNLFARRDPHIKFYLAEKEHKIIAGIIALAWQHTLIYWHGCSLEDAFKDYPNN